MTSEVQNIEQKKVNEFIDLVEYVMINDMVESGEFELIQAPLNHVFTPGLYTRIITMPPQSRFTTIIHKFEHPFFILKGKVSVFSENDGMQLLEAPYIGVTKQGTRRVLHVHEETIWATAHCTDIQPIDDSEEAKISAAAIIMNLIAEEHENKLLGGRYLNSVFIESKPELTYQNKIENHEH